MKYTRLMAVILLAAMVFAGCAKREAVQNTEKVEATAELKADIPESDF